MRATPSPHEQAMDLVESAVLERMHGDTERTEQLYAQALELELAAIQELEQRNDRTEPTWSVLHRSAGWMAFNSNQLRRSEQIAAKALAGDPHPEIAEELRDLLEQVNSHRHLTLRGVTLTADEIQISLSGPGVGFGRAKTSDLVRRFSDLTRFIHRIVEHKRSLRFRERGVRDPVTKQFPTFLSMPRTGSFAITMTIGQPTEQLPLPGMVTTNAIMDEFMDVMELAELNKMTDLREHVPDPSYLRNFIGLATKLAPDGNQIRQVGFTTISGGNERYLSIETPAEEFPLPPVGEDTQLTNLEPEAVVIRGVLRYADDIRQHVVQVVDASEKRQTVQVPEGMMNDIVRPYWNSNVTITGVRIGGDVTLQTIGADAAY
jgi:hypothetical protein